MSQQRKYKTKIVIPKPKLRVAEAKLTQSVLEVEDNPPLELLRKATQTVAERHGGHLDTFFYDCLGNKHSCWLAIKTEDLRRGIGLRISTEGHVTFHYDAASLISEAASGNFIGQARFVLDKAETAVELAQEIAQEYAVLASSEALKAMGCDVEVAGRDNPERNRMSVTGHDGKGRKYVLTVASDGGVFLDMIGFAGRTCEGAEQELRRRLQSLGLQMETTWMRRKPPAGKAGFGHASGVKVGA